MDDPTLTEWFCDNYMIINPDKCCFVCMGKNNNDEVVKEFSLKNSNEKTILGIKTDRKLTFYSYIKTLCTKTGQKLCALLRISNNPDLIYDP